MTGNFATEHLIISVKAGMEEAPHFERAPGLINKPDGSVLFECILVGNPQPEVTWFFKGQQLTNDDRHKMLVKKAVGKYTVTMTIKVSLTTTKTLIDRYSSYSQNPQQSDQGIYKIVAKNKKGETDCEQNYIMICTADQVYKW